MPFILLQSAINNGRLLRIGWVTHTPSPLLPLACFFSYSCHRRLKGAEYQVNSSGKPLPPHLSDRGLKGPVSDRNRRSDTHTHTHPHDWPAVLGDWTFFSFCVQLFLSLLCEQANTTLWMTSSALGGRTNPHSMWKKITLLAIMTTNHLYVSYFYNIIFRFYV